MLIRGTLYNITRNHYVVIKSRTRVDRTRSYMVNRVKNFIHTIRRLSVTSIEYHSSQTHKLTSMQRTNTRLLSSNPINTNTTRLLRRRRHITTTRVSMINLNSTAHSTFNKPTQRVFRVRLLRLRARTLRHTFTRHQIG